MTQREIKERILELKSNLYSTDYKALQFAEKEITESEFEPIRQKRKQWRIEINDLEKLLEVDNETNN